MNQIGVGIIGCGTILPVHLDNILAFEETKLISICDINKSLAQKVAKKAGCDWTTDYKEVLMDESISVVHILTPHYLHTPMAIEALNNGKHVVLEKPVAISRTQLEALRLAASTKDLTVGVTLQNRFNPTTVKMKEVADSGILGSLIATKGILTWNRQKTYYTDSNWRGKRATEGGGLLINQCIHTLDLMEYIGGPIESVRANVNNFAHPEIEVEDIAMVSLGYKNGAIGTFFGTNNYGDNSALEMGFVFEKGRLELRDRQVTLITEDKVEVLVADIAKNGAKSYWGVSHQLIIRDIYDSIIEGREPKVTIDDAIRASELIVLCYENNEKARRLQ